MAYFHCLIGGGSSGGGYELTVTCDADFAGTTITCTDGVTTLTQTCPSASPYEVVFAIPNGGEWTISGMVGAATYSESIDIPDSLELHSTPDGSTVTPTDVIQTWLACAGITDKAYTTLNEVLADSTTLLALISDNNASDYLVRSTTWASGLTADSTAMTDIGANNYCANTLLTDATWRTAICNSTYFESVLNAKIPTMTSNTTPSGVASASSIYSSDYEAWKAFNGNDSSYGWASTGGGTPWVQYQFADDGIVANKVRFYHTMTVATAINLKFNVQGSNDDLTFEDIVTGLDVINYITPYVYNFSNSTKYKYYRFVETTGMQGTGSGTHIQIWGR